MTLVPGTAHQVLRFLSFIPLIPFIFSAGADATVIGWRKARVTGTRCIARLQKKRLLPFTHHSIDARQGQHPSDPFGGRPSCAPRRRQASLVDLHGLT